MKKVIYYTGVGSRETPPEILKKFLIISRFLEKKGFILRTGDAKGADKYFRDGVQKKENKEVYDANDATIESMDMASTVHPAWHNCSDYAKKLHGRNCFQVLGKDLNTPSNFLICWTDNGVIKGGTATAINLALKNNIPVFNLGKDDFQLDRFRDYIKKII